MELRHLRYFVAVAEELHFRRAAERLHVAQPAVSEQIRKLEQELGVRLFDRTQRSVALTPAGTAMLEEARRVLRGADVAQQVARSAGDRAALRLRVGYLADSLPASVPRALRVVASSFPAMDVELETGPALRLVQSLRNGELDAVIAALPVPVAGLRVTPLAPQCAVAALPFSHPSALAQSIGLKQLAPERVVVLPRDANPAFHSAVVSMCRDAGLSPTFVEAAEPRVEDALLSVAMGAGVALIPEAAADRYRAPGVHFVHLATAEPAFQTAVLTRPDAASPVTERLLSTVAASARLRAVESAPSVPVAA